jgi:hypothetical protein
MESLYFNLSEQQFEKTRKILLWIFVFLFFLGGIYVLIISLVFRNETIEPVLSLAPFSISIIVMIIALYSTVRRKNLYFIVDHEKLEFRYGMIFLKKHVFNWTDIKELVMPYKQSRVKLKLTNGTSFIINLTWLEKKKAVRKKKNIYYTARTKNMNVIKVMRLKKKD